MLISCPIFVQAQESTQKKTGLQPSPYTVPGEPKVDMKRIRNFFMGVEENENPVNAPELVEKIKTIEQAPQRATKITAPIPPKKIAAPTPSAPKPKAKPENIPIINRAVKTPLVKPESIQAKTIFQDKTARPIITLKNNRTSKQSFNQSQMDLYKDIFSAQEKGDFKKADISIGKLKDHRLIGHVLMQRYLHAKYISSFEELRQWLLHYNDHPDAQKIYQLALNKKPSSYEGNINAPAQAGGIKRISEPTMRKTKRYASKINRDDAQSQAILDLTRSIRNDIRQGKNDEALNLLETQHAILDAVETDILRASIAAGYLYQGQVTRANDLAVQSLSRSKAYVPRAYWVAGLVAWKNDKYIKAAQYFEEVATSPYASSWTGAAGGYWAARANMRAGKIKDVSVWLERGAEHPRTFYGLLSTRALGRDFEFNWKTPPFTQQFQDVLNTIPAAHRAMALVRIDKPAMAQDELMRITPHNDAQHLALLSFADYANLPALGLRVGNRVKAPDGKSYDAALYPFSPWQPKDGLRIDNALTHAIMRQESKFNPWAQSVSGARGLMQLMPSTAASLLLQGESNSDHPAMNLELGQRYIEDLLASTPIKNDLMDTLIAYNAGPGNLAKWRKRWSDVEDPLLFIELISSSETRTYVERVLANYWIYRLRNDQPLTSMDAIAEGRAAIYKPNE